MSPALTVVFHPDNDMSNDLSDAVNVGFADAVIEFPDDGGKGPKGIFTQDPGRTGFEPRRDLADQKGRRG